MTAKLEVLLFDLGGVLVDFSGVRDIAPLLLIKASESEIRERWSRCPHTEAYCLGKLTRQEFSEKFVRDWGLNITPEQFLQEFQSWSRGFYPGAAPLIETLRSQLRLAALSNSNELHWKRNTIDNGVTDKFEMAISSHQVGICKPNPEIYLIAINRLGVTADAIMFFDDVKENVVVAKSLGMRAFQVNGVEGVRLRLESEHII